MSEYTYSAFISYKHDPDVTFAAAIQEQIEPLSVDDRDYDPERGLRNKKNRSVYKREFPRIAAPVLGISYDDLVKRQERYRKQRAFIMVNTVTGSTFLRRIPPEGMYFAWTRISGSAWKIWKRNRCCMTDRFMNTADS